MTMIGSYSDLLDKRSLHFTRRKLREKSFFHQQTAIVHVVEGDDNILN